MPDRTKGDDRGPAALATVQRRVVVLRDTVEAEGLGQAFSVRVHAREGKTAAQRSSAVGSVHSLRVRLSVQGDRDEQTDGCEEALGVSEFLRFKCDTYPEIDLKKISTEQTVRGVLAQQFQDLNKSTTDQDRVKELELAIKFAIKALDSERIDL